LQNRRGPDEREGTVDGIQLLEISHMEKKLSDIDAVKNGGIGGNIGDYVRGKVSCLRVGSHRIIRIPFGVLLLEVLLVYLLLADK